MNLRIDFQNRIPGTKVSYPLLLIVRGAIRNTLKNEGYSDKALNRVPFEVSVSFCDEEQIRALNAEYRGIDAATDVLSFPLNGDSPEGLSDPDEIPGQLGDIVLCLPVAKKQADEFGHPFEREVAFLTAHSVLHLLGYDHELGEAEETEMREKQRQIMERMGLTVSAE